MIAFCWMMAIEEAHRIYSELAKEQPKRYQSNLAGSLINMGILYENESRQDDARKAYEEALVIYRE